VSVEDLVHGDDRHHVFGHRAAPDLELLRHSGVGRGQVAFLHTLVEAHLPGSLADRRVHIDVARPISFERLELRAQRLDVHAAPAGLVEMLGDRMQVRVPRADVDVEPGCLFVEQAIQHHVFEVLRVGEHV
jgi:hypothetical protein